MAEVTLHAKREAAREAESAERIERQLWRDTLGRPLTHAIRLALDVDLDRDVAWVESCRDGQGEELLMELRPRVEELQPHDWLALRQRAPHVWRVLLAWRRGVA